MYKLLRVILKSLVKKVSWWLVYVREDNADQEIRDTPRGEFCGFCDARDVNSGKFGKLDDCSNLGWVAGIFEMLANSYICFR